MIVEDCDDGSVKEEDFDDNVDYWIHYDDDDDENDDDSDRSAVGNYNNCAYTPKPPTNTRNNSLSPIAIPSNPLTSLYRYVQYPPHQILSCIYLHSLFIHHSY